MRAKSKRLFELSERPPSRSEVLSIQQTGSPVSGRPQTGYPITAPPLPDPPDAPVKATPNPQLIRRALAVQDGHSLGEQLVLETLWNAASPIEGQDYRRIAIGHRA